MISIQLANMKYKLGNIKAPFMKIGKTSQQQLKPLRLLLAQTIMRERCKSFCLNLIKHNNEREREREMEINKCKLLLLQGNVYFFLSYNLIKDGEKISNGCAIKNKRE
jgi:hypothetical protein